MVGGTVMAYLGGLHFWWPKITGRLYPECAGASSRACIIFVGFNLTFFPQFILGYLGMPRRYHAYPPEFQVLNVLSSAGASILGVGYLLPLIYLIWSLRYGTLAGSNPWGAAGLEWTTPSPPPTENFAETPVVTWERLRLSRAGGGPRCLTRTARHAARITRRSRTTSTTSRSSARRPRSACGCSSSPRSCSSAACSLTYIGLPHAGTRTAFAAASHELDVCARHASTPPS